MAREPSHARSSRRPCGAAARSRIAVRATIDVARVCEISLLLGAAFGSAWQVDIHMYYFACVAMIAIYCDPIAILAATVAAHLLAFNFALSYAVLLLEAGGLIWTNVMLVGAFRRQDAEREGAVAARAEAQNATERLATTQESEHQAQTGRQAFQSAPPPSRARWSTCWRASLSGSPTAT